MGNVFSGCSISIFFDKLTIITTNNMIKMGGVIQVKITLLVFRIKGVFNCF